MKWQYYPECIAALLQKRIVDAINYELLVILHGALFAISIGRDRCLQCS